MNNKLYRIPSVECLENWAVNIESLVDTDFYLTVDYYECNGTWNYSWGDKIQQPDDVPRVIVGTQHAIRKIAAAKLLDKLIKTKE